MGWTGRFDWFLIDVDSDGKQIRCVFRSEEETFSAFLSAHGGMQVEELVRVSLVDANETRVDIVYSKDYAFARSFELLHLVVFEASLIPLAPPVQLDIRMGDENYRRRIDNHQN